MSTRQVLGAVGAVVGAYFGNPQLGYMIGSAIGGAVDPEVIKGPSIGDIIDQTSMEGGPRPFFYGLSKPIAGNIIAQGPPRRVKKRQRQGKGGPKVETESVYRTYAVGVGETVGGFVQVWRNGQLVYDILQGHVSDEGNALFLERARFFLGTFDQNPSPDLEALFGVGTTPAHRGTAYMVMADEDLTDLRGGIPQWTFRVQRCATSPAMILAVAQAGPGPGRQVMRSVDGVSFEIQDTPLDAGNTEFQWTSLVHSPELGLIVAVSIEGPAMTSEDGATWQLVSAPGDQWRDVAWSSAAGLFAAVRPHGTQAIMTSPDGVSWTLRNTPAFLAARAITFCEASGLLIAGQETIGGTDAVMTSPDGITWTPRLTVSGNAIYRFAVDGLRVWAVNAGETRVSESVDGGVTWGTRGGAPGFGLQDLAFEPGTRAFGVSVFGGSIAPGLADFDDIDDMPTGQWTGVCYSNTFGGFYATNGAGSGDSTPRVCKLSDGFNTPVHLATPAEASLGQWNRVIAIDSASAGGECLVAVSEIASDLCARANLPSSLIDVSALEEMLCRGLTVTNQYPALSALRALSEVFFFDPANIDGKVRFVPRGGNTVATVTEEDMLDDEMNIEESERKDPISVPRVVHMNYHDVAGGIATDKQTSERAGDRRATGELSVQSPVLMSADEAARVVAINHKVMIENQRGDLKFQLADNFIALTPTDNIVLQWQGRSVRARLEAVKTDDGSQEYRSLYDRQSAYVSEVEGIPAAPQTPPPSNVIGPTLIELLDIHILKDADDNVGLAYYVAVSGIFEAWQGAQVELSFDGGANYTDSATTSTAAIIGELLTELPDHPHEYPDEVHTVRVRIDTPLAELDTFTLEALMSDDTNIAIIGDELVQFAIADEVDEGEWDLSVLLRGRKGTSSETHAIGERFVMLDRSALTLVPANLADLGRTLTFRATSFGTQVETGTVVSMVFAGRTQIEREPAYLAARREASNVVVEWQGVGRLGAGINVAHGARFDGYRVTFDDGAIEETIDTTNEELTHDVTAYGSPITIRVAQLNALTGPGPEIEVELT